MKLSALVTANTVREPTSARRSQKSVAADVNSLQPSRKQSGLRSVAANLKLAPRTAELADVVSPKTVIRRNELLAKRTTLRVGGPADVYVEPASEEDLAAVLQFCGGNKLPFFLLGRGSNLLVRDGGLRGVVICLARPHFSRVEITGCHLYCGAGAKLKAVAVESKHHGLTGLEFLEGIPGSVGGALRMNAGAMGGWMFDVVESIRFMDHDGHVQECAGTEAGAGYRSCPLLTNHIALSAVLKGHPAAREVIEQRMKAVNQKRWATQPAAPSAGCIFKNPEAIPAGKLIEELGLKGTQVGGAVVSQEHGNFIVTQAKAKASHVLELMGIIKQRAKAERGIELEPEVQIVGED
jgi:UDP-N-acetylenolpyruvoylglucosamine reductase